MRIPPISKEQVVAIRIGDRPPVKDTASKQYLDTLSLAFYDEWTFADEIDRSTPEGSNRLTEKDKVIIDEFIDQYANKILFSIVSKALVEAQQLVIIF